MFNSKTEGRILRNEGIDKKKYFLIYTLIFIFSAFFINLPFIRENLTYLRDVDTFTQHYVALEYYGEWLREFFRTLFVEHRFEFRNFDFSIGMGADVVKALNYYAIGDPLNLLSVFVPSKHIPVLYTVIAVLRYYLAGIAFSLYCFERKHSNLYGVLTASVIYVFSTYGFLAGLNHSFFINPMIYLPLIFIAVEKILKNKNPGYLALIVCVAEVSNFYFFYMLVFATVAYVFIRFFTVYGLQIKKMIAPLFKIGISAISGVLLGAIIFLPVALSFLSDGRVSVEHSYDTFYSIAYYCKLLASMVYQSPIVPWTLVGSTGLFLYAITAVFMRGKKHIGLIVAFFICVFGLCSPAFGGFSNGFSYSCNRWCFIFTFVLAYMSSLTWEDLFFAENKIKSFAVLSLPVLYLGCCFYLPYTSRSQLKIALVIFAVFTLLLFAAMFNYKSARVKKLLQAAVAVVNILCVIMNGYTLLSSEAESHYTAQQAAEFVSAEFAAVDEYTKQTGDDSFYRFTSNNMELNNATRNKAYGTQYYWSLSDGYISDFQDSIYLNESFYQFYNGFDDSAVLNSLSSVKYYYDKTKAKGTVPFGFSKTEKENLYINDYVLPLAYTYDSYITREAFDALSTSAERQQAFMQGAVLEQELADVEITEPECSVKTPDFEIVPMSEFVTFDNNTFTVTKKNAKVKLVVKTPVSGETYFRIRKLVYVSTKTDDLFGDNTEVDPLNLFNAETRKEYDSKRLQSEIGKITAETEPEIVKVSFYTEDADGTIDAKELRYYTPFYRFYVGKENYDICLGYSETGFKTVTLSFNTVGRYSFEDFGLVAQDMDFYTDGVEKLRENVIENAEISTDSIKGTVSLDESKLLCFAVPYSKGWKAFVDGEEQPVLKANIMHTAVELPKGEHEIELVYTTPEMTVGAALSFCGLLLLFGTEMWYYIARKKNHNVLSDID